MVNKTQTVAQTIIEVLINHIHNIDIAKTFSILCLDECLCIHKGTGNASTGSSSSDAVIKCIVYTICS
jgi:hypothetical protein